MIITKINSTDSAKQQTFNSSVTATRIVISKPKSNECSTNLKNEFEHHNFGKNINMDNNMENKTENKMENNKKTICFEISFIFTLFIC